MTPTGTQHVRPPPLPAMPPGFVRRQRVLDEIDEAAHADVLVMRAPEGSGKSTALADWCRQQSNADIVWIACGSNTRTSDGLWAALADALVWSSDERPSPASVAAHLNQRNEPTVIVLDGVDAPAATTSEVARLAALLHQTLIIVATRRPSTLESAVHRVQLHVATLTAQQLWFTPEEIGALDADVDAQALHAATGGHPLLTCRAIAEGATTRTDAAHLAADWIRSMLPDDQVEFALLISLAPAVDADPRNLNGLSRRSALG